MTVEKNKDTQVKSKQRVVEHGEVFTNEREVNAMLDLVQSETERIDSRFLEPACGNGNFLAEVLRRKLHIVKERYAQNQYEWEFQAILAISSLYGVDILQDNAEECRARLFDIFEQAYSALYAQKCKDQARASARFLLHKNILWGDALDFTNPQTKAPIIFAEWTAEAGELLKRRDYMFRFLVEQSFQAALFGEEGEAALVQEPVKEYPLTHFLKLADDTADA